MTATEYPVQWAQDLAARYGALLLRQWQRPRRQGVLRALLAEVQAVEDMLHALRTETNLDTAIGVQLDLIGKLLGTPRVGLSDEPYRLRLRVEILVLRSNGHPDDLIAILLAALPAGDAFSYAEFDFATTYVTVRAALDAAVAAGIVGYLKRAKSLGTRVLLVSSEYAPEKTFAFAASMDTIYDGARGFGDSSDASVGGHFAGVST